MVVWSCGRVLGSGADHPFLTDHSFMASDFAGGAQALRNPRFGEQDFVTKTSFKAKAVRGTRVDLQVVVEDECGNVGFDSSDPSRECDTFVSGRCCPAVANAVSQFSRNQILQVITKSSLPVLMLAHLHLSVSSSHWPDDMMIGFTE